MHGCTQAFWDKEHCPYITEETKLQMCVNPVLFSYKKVKHGQEQNTLPSSCPLNMPLILPRRKRLRVRKRPFYNPLLHCLCLFWIYFLKYS